MHPNLPQAEQVEVIDQERDTKTMTHPTQNTIVRIVPTIEPSKFHTSVGRA